MPQDILTTPAPVPTAPADLRRQILDDWAGPPHDPDLARPELLHELFEAAAARRPTAAAVECGGATLTYAQLDAAANRLAGQLRELGSRPGQFVAFLLPRSIDVYVTLLAILKSGAAYVPLDPEYPADRIAFILGDCQAQVLVTTTTLAKQSATFTGLTLLLDGPSPATADGAAVRFPGTPVPDNIAYVIYTSGTTGRPKGTLITHRSVCNLVRAEGRLFGVRPTDRVYQGFSIAFDASVEEVWLAFFAGATLVGATAEMVHAGPDLARLLTAADVTIFSTVPTMLAMLTDDLPGVRLLILGGEACPADLVRRWDRPGRRMVNTYGPTEATVIASWAECAADRPVTIGRAVPNYRLYILDPETRAVLPPGAAGELCIAGPGVSAGYLRRPDLTAEKFIPNPFCAAPYDRLYRTGDLARWNAAGEIEFLGRIDAQVKIRGFRVELAEIEAVLMTHPAVRAAAVALREDAPGLPQLVAYVVPAAGGPAADETLRAHLRPRLPGYMIPAVFETIAALPTLSSGKVDRKSLPRPAPRAAAAAAADGPRTPLEKKLGAAWAKYFAVAGVSRTADFFLDLGGHSLLAARLVSELRQDPDLADLSVLDLYHYPTLEKLAAALEGRSAARAAAPAERPLRRGRELRRSHGVCGLFQFLALYFVVGFYSMQWLTPYLTYAWMIDNQHARLVSVFASLAALLGLYPAMLLGSVALKWLLLGRIRPGNYPLWGWFFFRWWFVQRILGAIPVDYLEGTPLINWYYRAMGTRVGRNVYFGSDNIAAFDVVSVGDDSSIGMDSSLMGYSVDNGYLRIAPIRVGSGCHVGAGSFLRGGAVMENGATLGHLSLLPEGARIPAGETWVGSPARPLGPGRTILDPAPAAAAGRLRRAWFGCLHAVGVFTFPVFHIAALLPGIVLLNDLSAADTGYSWLLAAPAVALSFIVLLAAEIVAVKWLLLGRVRPGVYPVYSWFYVRKWFVDGLMDISLDILGPMYATLYLAPWYRALGAKVGRRAEISTACSASPDLLAIDDESFVADAVVLGVPRVDRGRIGLTETRIGKRAFVGNSALVPAGTVLGDGALIGCLSTPPEGAPVQAETSWLGSPAVYLPQRQASAAFSAERTFNPTRKLYLQRLGIEFLRLTTPITIFVVFSSLLIMASIALRPQLTTGQSVLVFPLLYAGAGAAAALLMAGLKWLLMGRYRPQEQPLWSVFLWKSELVNALHEDLAGSFFTGMLIGTPFLCWFFRLLGAKIGRRVYMESAEITEFDLVTIGDEATINSEATLQTHLFEDRVMKMSTVTIGARCSVGAGSVVLYDSVLEAESYLDDLSLVMKGETLPAGTRWQGTPARRDAITQNAKLKIQKGFGTGAQGHRDGTELEELEGVAAGEGRL